LANRISIRKKETLSMKKTVLWAGIFLLLLSGLAGLSRAALSPGDLYTLLRDLPRHNSFKYVTRDSLPEGYFEAAYQSLDDPYVYIVLSDTGSPAARIIGVFTGAAYNHVSLSFDGDLKTLVSYNGGNGVSGPGLNRETLDDLNRKPGASLVLFRLKVTAGQKRALISRVAAINREGSSYTLLGLLTKTAVLPNIMFCSQFVYTLLNDAGAAYFSRKNGRVRPMDFCVAAGGKGPEYAGGVALNSGASREGGSFFLRKTLDSRSITAYNLIGQVEK
jgi:hypothetical protein